MKQFGQLKFCYSLNTDLFTLNLENTVDIDS